VPLSLSCCSVVCRVAQLLESKSVGSLARGRMKATLMSWEVSDPVKW
jgi:hypothetical protein